MQEKKAEYITLPSRGINNRLKKISDNEYLLVPGYDCVRIISSGKNLLLDDIVAIDPPDGPMISIGDKPSYLPGKEIVKINGYTVLTKDI